jgi:hypothetical protein
VRYIASALLLDSLDDPVLKSRHDILGHFNVGKNDENTRVSDMALFAGSLSCLLTMSVSIFSDTDSIK